MSKSSGRTWHAFARRVRGIRARLVLTFVLAAALAGLVGVLIFNVVLARALASDVDSNLELTARYYATNVDYPDKGSPPRVDRTRAAEAHSLQSVVAVFGPHGSLLAAQPRVLPANLYPGRTLATRAGLDTVRYAGVTIRRYWLPVPTPHGPGLVVIGQSLRAVDDANSDARQVLYAIVPVAIVLSGLGAWLLSGAALRPVERMRADAQRLGETGGRGQIGAPSTSDSLERLADTFNALLAKQQTSLDRQRALVADAGHELRTPLTVLQTELDTADRPGRTREDLADSIAHARAETTRLAQLADDLLLLAQSDGGARLVRLEPVDVTELISRVARSHREQFELAGISLEADTGTSDRLIAELDPSALQRILDNLLRNAAHHGLRGGTVWVSAQVGDNSVQDARELIVSVADNGPGFPSDFLSHAFERFSRADRSRRRSAPGAGTGLGLSIVAALVSAHGGSVTAANRVNGGAVITVTLPLDQVLKPD